MQGPPPPLGPYPSHFLNELHAYFPALLYHTDRFHSTHSVLNYITGQMRNQFDTYSSWRGHYHRTVLQNHIVPSRDPWAPPTPQQQQPRPRPRTTTSTHAAAAQPIPVVVQATQQPVTASSSSALLDLLAQSFLSDPVLQPLVTTTATGPPVTFRTPFSNITYRAPPLTASFLDPVPVAPTPEQLQLGSITYPTATALDTPCAICQDGIAAGDTVRKLLSCNHVFHRACVDVWFQSHVNCPVCRHDIRSHTPVPRSPAHRAAPPPSADPPPAL